MPKLRIKVKNSSHLLPKADLGAGRGDRGHHFFFEILYDFYKNVMSSGMTPARFNKLTKSVQSLSRLGNYIFNVSVPFKVIA